MGDEHLYHALIGRSDAHCLELGVIRDTDHIWTGPSRSQSPLLEEIFPAVGGIEADKPKQMLLCVNSILHLLAHYFPPNRTILE